MVRIRSARELRKLPRRSQESRERALKAVATARRDGITIRAAARETGVSVGSVRKYAAEALRKDVFGRLRATAADRLLRVVLVIRPGGKVVSVGTRGSRVASTVAEYWTAVRNYLATGDSSELERFKGKRAGGVALETDPDVIDEQARRGELEFESIYHLAN